MPTSLERTRPLRPSALAVARQTRPSEALHGRLTRDRLTTVALLAAPGAGTTTLVDHTVRKLEPELVIIAGPHTSNDDAARLAATGRPLHRLSAEDGPIDAVRLEGALAALAPAPGSLVLLDRVALDGPVRDLPDVRRVIVMAVTEAATRPLEHAATFRAAAALVLTRADLVAHQEVDVVSLIEHARNVNPSLPIFPTAAGRGDGMREWCAWLRALVG